MSGNKIDINRIGTYEIEIAKCGWLRLVWLANPTCENWYEVQSNGEKVFKTMNLKIAIEKYNELTS